MEWNILATAFMRRERALLKLMRNFGEFKGSGYRDVLLGKVEDVHAFLEQMETLCREQPRKVSPLSQIVPIEKTFEFSPSDFRDGLKEAISPYAENLENSKFYVRIKRRGHKGELSSQEIEKEMAAFILDFIGEAGKQAQVSFEDPDKFIIVETIENRAGVGLITREMRERYPFIKVK
jgi:tRNA(Ser,Leu) C12 N-acetylase TAN1